MSKHQMGEDGKTLPKPIAMTREELHQVAAGTALRLGPEVSIVGAVHGVVIRHGPPLEV